MGDEAEHERPEIDELGNVGVAVDLALAEQQVVLLGVVLERGYQRLPEDCCNRFLDLLSSLLAGQSREGELSLGLDRPT